MKKLDWNGTALLLVPALVESRCTGCAFGNEQDEACPHTTDHISCTIDNDIICIHDTEEAVAAYMARRLE